MPALTIQSLRTILHQAYKEGNTGPLDLMESSCNEILIKALSIKPEESKNEDGWRIYSAYELRCSKVGTIFEHSSRGIGIIKSISIEEKAMFFHDGSFSLFYADDYPWNERMKLIGTTSKTD